jgi:hypothetical protein
MSYTGRRDSGFNVYACSQGSLMVYDQHDYGLA